MVSAKSSRAGIGRKRLGLVLSALAAPLALSSACGKLVGVGDTEVATGGAADAVSGGASTQSGGAKATGGGSGTSGGSLSSGGSGTTGGASAATGGKSGQGGSATSGGSAGTPEGGDSSAGDAGASSGGTVTVTGGTGSGGAGAGGKAGAGGVGGKGGAGGTGGVGGKGGAGGSTGGASGGAGGSGGGCNPACPLDKPTCEAGVCVVRGPTMVKVSGFYVDSTEVTVAQYQTFLTAKGSNTSGQPAVCSWNTSYYDTTIPMNPDTWPMSNVDWCDANAFCSWAGKHLCGKIGGGAVAEAELFTANVSQWYLACGGPSGGSHPNANPMCNSNWGNGNVVPVASMPGCEGFYPGLFDLEGNVAEWIDGCVGNTGAADICYLMGGGFYDQKSYCTEVYDEYPRNDSAGSFGFRCCSG